VGGATVPYGFTVLNAAAGGVLIQTHGPPSTAAALLFLCGAVAGFTAAASLAGRAGDADAPDFAPHALGLCSGVAALGGFACAVPIAHAIDGPLAFGAVGLTVTSVYLSVGALVVALLEGRS
jgi:hypothetical protein